MMHGSAMLCVCVSVCVWLAPHLKDKMLWRCISGYVCVAEARGLRDKYGVEVLQDQTQLMLHEVSLHWERLHTTTCVHGSP